MNKRPGSPPIIQFDPRFILFLRILWRLIRLPFKIVYFLFNTVLKFFNRKSKNTENELSVYNLSPSDLSTTYSPEAKIPKGLSDSRAFLSFGGIFWVADLTPRALKKELLNAYPDDEIVTIKYQLDKQEKSHDIILTGEISSEQIISLGELISNLFENKKIEQCNLRVILICDDLGKYLDLNGVPDRSVPGFSIDHEGAVLVAKYVLNDLRLANQFFEKIFEEDLNYIRIREKARETIWNYAESISNRMSKSGFYSPPDSRKKYGSFYGHHIIDQDSQITDGIFLGLPAKEAIWIDPSSSYLENIFNQVYSKIKSLKIALGQRLEEKILSILIDTVRRSFPRDTDQALRQLRDSLRISPDDEVSIDTFVSNETGDHDHQSLLAGYLIERIQREFSQYLTGSVSVDRNWIPGIAHTWIRYTSAKGEIYILDPKSNFMGLLDDYSVERWPYERPSDLPRQRVARPI